MSEREKEKDRALCEVEEVEESGPRTMAEENDRESLCNRFRLKKMPLNLFAECTL